MKLGLIVNPIAGMGGRVGLKGTDSVLEEAIAKGAKPIAPKRAKQFLQKLRENLGKTPIEFFTCPGIMGEKEARTVGFSVKVLPMKIAKETSAEDTKTAVRLLTAEKVDLIVFVGGDGTAKDIFDATPGCHEVPVLGVPSGVKMYSGVFAVNPSDAVHVVLAFAENQAEITEFEIMDTDEKGIRSDTFSVELHGFLKGPFIPMRIQGSKQISPETVDEKENQIAIARFIVEEMQPNGTYILGPGTTVKRLAELLGVEKTVLGVDIYKEGRVILDVNEKRILKEVRDWQKAWIVLSPIGHQGILLGRGNQQISPEIIKRAGKLQIIIVATRNKLRSIDGNTLRVDTGDAEADKMLKGYIKVITDYKEWRLVPVQ
ncbi:MAG: ATP-NAD kinase family protein [Candidatus Bathyarchaeota archaeon]|nr:ATP-NAD kinase family protein [Candidatus Bathyarchaeota archaeon]MDH5788347.1 ATP-NAD kinase family protein [Candidatus Bathyarchaeota archaeon]